MSQRRAALLAALILFLALAGIAGLVPVPYAVLVPGPACNTVGAPTSSCQSSFSTGLIKITPASYVHPKSDTLDLTTIGELTTVSLYTAVRSYFTHSDAVVPRALLIQPGQTSQQVNAQDTQEMTQSQSSATIAALSELGLVSVSLTKVVATGPSASVLKAGDVVRSLDGVHVTNSADLVALLGKDKSGARLVLQIERAGRTRSVSVVAGNNPNSPGAAFLGVEVTDVLQHGITVQFGLQGVGGPSAGLMLTLGILDLFSPTSLTGPHLIAGTGTIDDLGNVGSIGGIQQKMYAARHAAHAAYFFAPAGDCADARGAIPSGLRVISVSTLTQALADLADIRAGTTSTLPGCG